MSRRQALGIGALLVVLVQGWLVAIGLNPLNSGGGWDQLWDPDSFTRVLRVSELASGERWFDPVFRGANFPDGFTLHWSRLLDVLLLLPAKVASVAVPFDVALLGWSITLGPALQILGILLLGWGTRPFLGPRRFLLVAALFAAQRGISYDFVPGQVDHHGLQVLLLVASLAALYREPYDRRAAYAAGAAGGLALWASAESLVIVFALVAALGIQWILGEEDSDGRRLLRYGAALLATSAVALVCERSPATLGTPSYERISIVQVALAAAAFAAGAALSALGRTPWSASAGRRLAAAAGVGGAAVLALLAVFPALTRNPYGATPAVVQQQLLPHIAAEQMFLPTGPDAAYNFTLEIGPGLLALGYCLLRLSRPASLDRAARSRFRLSAVAIGVFTAYAIYAFRGTPFVAAASIVPWAEAISSAWLYARGAGGDAPARRRIVRWVAPAAAAGGFWAVAGAIAILWMPAFVVSNAPACRWDRVAPFIPRPGAAALPRAVLTSVFDGPEVAFRTGRPVIAAPYHGNGEGIEAAYRMLAAGPDAIALLDARGVEWVALCLKMSPDTADVLNRNPFGLGARLLSRLPPRGLVEVPVPPDAARDFVLYRRESGYASARGR